MGDVFAIFIPNTPEYAIAFLGVAAAGGINTTVNVLYSEQDLLHQLKDSGSRFLLTVPEFLDRALPAAKKSGIEEVFVLGEKSNGATSLKRYSEKSRAENGDPNKHCRHLDGSKTIL